MTKNRRKVPGTFIRDTTTKKGLDDRAELVGRGIRAGIDGALIAYRKSHPHEDAEAFRGRCLIAVSALIDAASLEMAR